MVRRPMQSKKVKIVFTLKPRFFEKGTGDFEAQFQKLLKWLSGMSKQIEEFFSAVGISEV